MIKGVMSGKGINVLGGTNTLPYVPTSSNNPIQGMIRVYGQDMQVFDGSSWMNIATNYPSIELDAETQSLLDWARTERSRQITREAKIRDNPALQKAHEAILRAEENFEFLYKFVEHDNNDHSEVQASP